MVHRDVKATNILLNARLEAKITDFGLSKAFDRHNRNYISTNTLVGTPGYVDPEYHVTMQPTTKSNVYSFGVARASHWKAGYPAGASAHQHHPMDATRAGTRQRLGSYGDRRIS